MMSVFAFIVVGVWLLVLGSHARRLAADWREPVLSAPVLVIESDDWGPGPPGDAQLLHRLATALQAFRDCRRQPPVVTLGVVLAVPGGHWRTDGGAAPPYVPQVLDAPAFATIREAMVQGSQAGVFGLQLHGMEHFWPPALERAAQADTVVSTFLRGSNGVPRHEALPSHLQARWIDASRLPSTTLSRREIERAASKEVECFARVFGVPARVAVPVTFTWTRDVEAAWVSHGIRIIVTPGTRNVGRDVQGRLIGERSILRNCDPAEGGAVYVVRDIYFEPSLGHTAERTLPMIRAHHRLGRPALLEMHRFNFTGEEAQAEASLAEVNRLLLTALAEIPQLRFMSTEALAEALVARDPKLVDLRLAARVRAFILRAATQHRLRRLAWLTGLAPVAAAVLAIASALCRTSAAQREPR